ncbi:hypothetical protein SAMN05444161_5899 [Rhizobiales bacterium GAS191]|nr:hypothetical protein SAMN05444161_5899 [Rhizobiales bacterium GAS191]
MNLAVRFAWMPLDPDGRLRWLKYAFGPEAANALAVRLR